MINFVLEQVSKRVMNDKGRRMMLVVSLYTLIAKAQGKELQLERLNEELRLVIDLEGCHFTTDPLVCNIIWSKQIKKLINTAPVEKIIRHILVKRPKWLDYKHSTQFNFENDMKVLEKHLTQ